MIFTPATIESAMGQADEIRVAEEAYQRQNLVDLATIFTDPAQLADDLLRLPGIAQQLLARYSLMLQAAEPAGTMLCHLSDTHRLSAQYG